MLRLTLAQMRRSLGRLTAAAVAIAIGTAFLATTLLAGNIMTRTGYVKGSPNVLIMTHVPSSALDDPNQARDQAVEKEIYSAFSKEKGEAAVRGYEKYRTFVDNGNWQTVTMAR